MSLQKKTQNKDIDVPVARKYARVTRKTRKPEWVMCPKCRYVILLRDKK